MDLVRLAIVYDTGQAASNLQQLDRQLKVVQGSHVGATGATRGLEGALRALAVQATGVSGPVGHLSTALLGLGTSSTVVIGVLAGIAVGYAILFERSKAIREETDKLAKSFADAAHAGAAFTFISAQADLTAALEKLASMERTRTFLEKNINIGGATGEALRVRARIIAGVTDADIVDQHAKIATLTNLVNAYRDAWRDTHDAIIHSAEALDRHLKALKDARIPAIQAQVNAEMAAGARQGRPPGEPQFPFGTQFFESTHQGGIIDLDAIIAQNNLIEKLSKMGLTLDTISNAGAELGNDFKLAGKSVLDFVGFLAQAIGILIPNNPALSGAIMGIGSVIQSGIAGGGTSGGPQPGTINSARPQVVTNVNFSVQAMDAQGVAQFVERNGPQLAAEITRQADRSRAIRRRFWRT
jgi:hypothetical protein